MQLIGAQENMGVVLGKFTDPHEPVENADFSCLHTVPSSKYRKGSSR